MSKMLIIEGDIPENVIISCPLKNGRQTYATGCAACHHFGGLLQLGEGDAGWSQLHRIMCTHPVARTLTEIMP